MIARALVIAALLLGAAACASSPLSGGDLTAPPTRLPAWADDELAGGGWSVDEPNADWGVGYVLINGGPREAVLPLFDAPDGRHWGWLMRGRGYDQATRTAPPERRDARVTLGDGRDGFLALEERRGGWVRLRWGGPRDMHGGVGWTRISASRGGRARLVEWDDHFRDAGGLIYRNAASAHNLRTGPGTENDVVTAMSGRDFDMAALEIRGDWMRVRYSSPPACGRSLSAERRADDLGLLGGAGESAPTDEGRTEHAGWVRWRSPERGPWVRERPGGCAARTS